MGRTLTFQNKNSQYFQNKVFVFVFFSRMILKTFNVDFFSAGGSDCAY